MNSMMASSNAFWSARQIMSCCAVRAEEEYLIEFLLREDADRMRFRRPMQLGASGNGPTITRPLVRMMNALSDGTMIL
ncbi:MAG: hypothetical protein ACLSB9_28655 [Hydrogeniiclostridium mannosilyticum]